MANKIPGILMEISLGCIKLNGSHREPADFFRPLFCSFNQRFTLIRFLGTSEHRSEQASRVKAILKLKQVRNSVDLGTGVQML